MRISDWSSDVCSSDLFNLDDIARSIADKLVARHPHIFGNESTRTVPRDEHWEAIKAQERVDKGALSAIYGVARSEERRVGKECVNTCRSRWSPDHSQKKPISEKCRTPISEN